MKNIIIFVIVAFSVFGMAKGCQADSSASTMDHYTSPYNVPTYPVSTWKTPTIDLKLPEIDYNLPKPSSQVTSAPVPQSTVKYYTNTNGYRVQSPTHYSSRPAGATARCVDGTYSFSRSRRGTCSHHGGVAVWY